MKLQLNFIGLLGARGAKLTLGLATMFAYARIFGVSATYDAWVWALGLVNALSMLLFGPITETIRASYASIDQRDGRLAAEQYIATVAVLMIGSAIGVCIVSMLVLPLAATQFVPRQSGQGPSATFFLYALGPSLILSQMVAILTAHLNCRSRVYAPEVAGILGGCVGLVFIVVFPRLPAAWLLIGSYYIGLLAPLAVGASFWPEVIRALSHLEWPIFRRHAREALIFSLPLLLPYGFGQLGGIVERQYALLAGTGALSVLSYAFFARNTVQAVFTAALSALAVPALARSWNTHDTAPFRTTLAHWLHQCLMLATVGMIFLFGLANVVPPLLFGKAITADHQILLAQLLRFYAVAIVAVILYLLGGSALLAARRGKTYATLGAAASLASLLLLVLLFPLIGIAAIPIGVAISHMLAAMLMFRSIHRAEMWRVLGNAALRIGAILVGGSVVQAVGYALPMTSGLLLRTAIMGMAALLIAGAWWLVEHRLGRKPVGPTFAV
ncbi:lipid II flippase MurJ [Sphingomonas sp. S-NIH.Pt1_0416]|uniref:lipid II flippase MurJ n=1 Tax=Sphingomonas sp. S-NIH.Pt1_0416 TaxID=1920123 RepID=UPI000F7ECF19|nr:lipid II flippase MurJ [Sphingomonas sp. S-NIH.Pt1_0416]